MKPVWPYIVKPHVRSGADKAGTGQRDALALRAQGLTETKRFNCWCWAAEATRWMWFLPPNLITSVSPLGSIQQTRCSVMRIAVRMCALMSTQV